METKQQQILENNELILNNSQKVFEAGSSILNIKNGAGTNSLMQKEDAGKYTDAKPNFV
jgi:hypothetical protein